MTAAEEAKKCYGYKSLTQVAKLFGCTTKALRHWHKHNHQRFTIIMIGAKAFMDGVK